MYVLRNKQIQFSVWYSQNFRNSCKNANHGFLSQIKKKNNFSLNSNASLSKNNYVEIYMYTNCWLDCSVLRGWMGKNRQITIACNSSIVVQTRIKYIILYYKSTCTSILMFMYVYGLFEGRIPLLEIFL